VNRQITRVAVVGLVLLASLIVGTTYWQAWAASGLADRQDNAIQRVAEFSVKRGKIIAADDKTILADNYTRKVGNQKLYFRKYPQRGLAAHIVGYSTQVRSRAGLEESENDFLTGSNTNLSTVVDTTLSKLKGETIKGNDLHLTIQPKAQRVALNALGGKCGAAVALDTKTGAMLVSVSSPTYDPNLVESHFKLAARPRFGCAPLFNRAESGLYIPGSAFKVVTASAALDSGKFNVNSTFYDPGYCTEYGKQVLNFADQSGPERFGTVTFTASRCGTPATPKRRRPSATSPLPPASSTRSTPSIATSGRRSGRRRSSTTRSGSASTRCRRSRLRSTSARSAASTTRAGCSSRRTTSRSTRAGSPSDRSGCRSRRCRWR